MKFWKLVSAAIALVLSASVNAATILTNLGDNNYGINLDPITFTLTSNQSVANRVVLEDFFQNPTTADGIDISGSLNWSLNGGTANIFSFETNSGVCPCTSGQIDPDDLLFNYTIDYNSQGISPLNAGDTITVWTTDMVFSTTTTMLQADGPYTAHLLNGVTSIATIETSPVPVPAAVWLFGSGLIGLVGFARRKKA